jgi:hypothetical protein
MIKIIVSGNDIVSLGGIDEPWDDGQTVECVDSYPTDEDGNYLPKWMCRYVDGIVIRLSESALLSLYKEKKFREFNAYVYANIFSAGKTLAEALAKIQEKYSETYTTEQGVDDAIEACRTYIFT